MNVTKFYGKVNDQEFDNVNDYNAAVTAAAANGSFETSSRTWVEQVEDEYKDRVKKVTKFEGQVNNQVFDNVEDYNKAIIRAMNDDDLEQASSYTWVETEVVGSTRELEEPLPQIDKKEHDYSQKQEEFKKTLEKSVNITRLEKIFDEFIQKINNTNIDESKISQFINKLDLYLHDVNTINKDDLDECLTYLEQEYDDLADNLDIQDRELEKLKADCDKLSEEAAELEASIQKSQSLLQSMYKDLDAKKLYFDDLDYNSKHWNELHSLLGETMDKYTIEKSDLKKEVSPSEKANYIQKQEKLKKPEWMSQSYFNLLKEIFS